MRHITISYRPSVLESVYPTLSRLGESRLEEFTACQYPTIPPVTVDCTSRQRGQRVLFFFVVRDKSAEHQARHEVSAAYARTLYMERRDR